MAKLTVASVAYAACQPYRLLADLPFVTFEENDPVENRRRLHEQEVDIALIPASEFAIHGGYVGLDFGFGCNDRSSLILCSNEPVGNLDTIYLYEGSCCSAYLLRVLLREKWSISPRLVRVQHDVSPGELGPREGVLVRAESTHEAVTGYAVRHDLVSEWHAVTKSPFVFLIWAMRPGVLSMRQHQQFNEVCHRAAAARSALSAPLPNPLSEKEQIFAKFVRERHFFYLDESSLEGYREFCHRANRLNLLPSTDYRSATFSLLSRKPTDDVKLRGVGELLQDVVDGRRLSIREGVRLARRASLPDLGLAADILRRRTGIERRVNKFFVPTVAEIRRYAEGDRPFAEFFPSLLDVRPNYLRLPLLRDHGTTLAQCESLLVRLRAECALPIEGTSVEELQAFAAQEGMPIERVIARMVTAGLTAIRTEGGGILIDRLMRKHRPIRELSAMDWTNGVKWVHRYGARSVCSLTLSNVESWEDRLIHLHKLRSIQDENPGFAYFSFDSVSAKRRTLDPESKVRAILLGRLFLDNVPTVHVSEHELQSIGTLVGVSLGATDVEVTFGSRDLPHIDKRLEQLSRLSDVGLPLGWASPTVRELVEPTLH